MISRAFTDPPLAHLPTTRRRARSRSHRVVQCRGSANRRVDANGFARASSSAASSSSARLRVTPSASSDYEREISARVDEAFALDELNGNGRRGRRDGRGADADDDDALAVRARRVTLAGSASAGRRERRRTAGKTSQAQGPTLGLVTVPRTRTGRRSGGAANPLRALFESL